MDPNERLHRNNLAVLIIIAYDVTRVYIRLRIMNNDPIAQRVGVKFDS